MNMNYLVTGTPPRRAGNAHQNIVPYQVFACADGHLILAVGNDGQFAQFCDVAGRPAWAPTPASRPTPTRVRHRDVLVPLVAQVIATRGRSANGSRRSRRADVPCGPINRSTRCSPIRRSSRAAMRHGPAARAGRHASRRSSRRSHVGDAAGRRRVPPPLLGEHTSDGARASGSVTTPRA